MRNLKRALSLALASVMVLGLMVVGSGASYKDVSSEQNQEAIEVLQAVGVMVGDDNGNFNPDSVVTRNEMAVVVSNLMDYRVATYAGTSPFTDVPAWAEPYVAACWTNGNIAGYSATTFGGSDSVTTAQAALMLMKALGYFQYASDFEDDWQLATVKQANKIDLFDDVDSGVREAMTRNDLAQLVLNTLKATMVEADDSVINVNTPDGTSVQAGKISYYDVYKAGTEYRAISGDDYVGGKYTVELGEELYKGDLKLTDTSSDDFGRPAVEWKYVNDSIGVFAEEPDATYTKKVTAADIYSVVGKSTADDLNDGAYKLYNYIDGMGGQVTANITSFVDKNNTTKVNGSGNGMLTEVFVDDDAKRVTIVSINTYVFQASTDYNATKESVDVISAGDTEITLASRTLEQDDFDVKDVKADDYLLITAAKQANGTYDVQTVAKAEVLTGEVTGYMVKDSVILDGTTYKYSLTATDSGEKNTQYTVGQTAAVVLDAYGYVIAVDEAVVSSNYVYVSEFAQPSGLSNGKVVAHAYFTDGTSADITIKDRLGDSNKGNIMGSAVSGKYTANAGWYTYSKNSDNEYSLYAIETKYSTAKVAYNTTGSADKTVAYNNEVNFLANGNDTTLNSGNAYIGKDGGAIKANNDTIIVVDDGDDVTYYTGVKNLPDIVVKYNSGTNSGKATVNAVYKTSNSYAAYVFIDVTGASSIAGGEDSSLVYFVKYDGQHKTTDNEVYYTYKVLVDGKETIVRADTQILGTSTLYSAYYKARTNADEEITSIVNVPISAGEKFIAADSQTSGLSYSAGTLTVGTKGYTLADDYKITLVVLKSANALNKDKDADYEAQIVTAKELSDLVKGYNVTYNYELKATEKDGSELEELYVTVTAASEAVADSTDATVKSISVKGVPAVWNATTEQYEVTLSATQAADTTKKYIEVALNEAHANRGTFSYTVANGSSGTWTAGTEDGTNAITGWGTGNSEFTFTVTAQAGNTANYKLVVTIKAAASSGLSIASDNAAAIKVVSNVITILTDLKGQITVDELLMNLKISGTKADGDKIVAEMNGEAVSGSTVITLLNVGKLSVKLYEDAGTKLAQTCTVTFGSVTP